MPDLQAQLEQAANDPNPKARAQKLRFIQAEIDRVAGLAQTYAHDQQLVAESEDMATSVDILAARRNADIRAEMLKRGMATEAELDDKGMLSHEDLDRLAEEGRLEESVGSLVKAFGLGLLHGEAFNLKVRRGPGGEFLDKPGGGPKGRGGGKLKSAFAKAAGELRDEHKVPGSPRFKSEPFHKTPHPNPEVAGSRGDIVKEMEGKRGAVKGKRFKVRATDPGGPGEVVGSGTEEYYKTPRPPKVRPSGALPDLVGQEASKEWQKRDKELRRALRKEKDPEKKKKLEAELEKLSSQAKSTKGRQELGTQHRFRETSKAANKRVEKAVQKAGKKGKLKGDEPAQMKGGKQTKGTQLSQAEVHFNEAGRVSQRTLLSYVNEACSQPTTAEMFRNEDGSYDPSRQPMHDALIDAAFRERGADGGLDPNGAPLQPADGEPTVIFSGGGYASGKGAMLKRLAAEGKMPDNALVIDPDVIKAAIPEYSQSPEDAERNMVVYQEAWDIAQEIQRQAQERGFNVVVDGISNTSADEMAKRIQGFTDAGYVNPRVAYITIPTDESRLRAGKRAEEAKTDADRRMIPDVIMRAVHRDVAATIPALMERSKELGVHIDVFDNNRGKDEHGSFRPPEHIAEATPEGDINVPNEQLFQEALNKANEGITGVDKPDQGNAPMPVSAKAVETDINEREKKLGEALAGNIPAADAPDATNPVTDTDEFLNGAPERLGKLQALLNQGSGLDKLLNAEVFDANDSSSKSTFEQFGQHVLSAEPDKRFILIGPTKKLDRTKEKLRSDPETLARNGKDPNAAEKDASTLADSTRATILTANAADLPEAMDTFVQHVRDNGWQIKGIKNRLVGQNGSNRSQAHGYGDIMLKLVDPDGNLHEVQFNEAGFWHAKEIDKGHDLYVQMRPIYERADAEGRPLTEEEKAQLVPLMEESRHLYDGLWTRAMMNASGGQADLPPSGVYAGDITANAPEGGESA